MSKRNAAVLDAPTAGTAQAPSGIDHAAFGVPASPQVNLLPPEFRSKRALGKVKARLAMLVLLVVLVAAVGYVYAAFEQRAAAQDLAAKQQQVADLQAEAQQYAVVPQIKGQIANAQSALEVGTSTEVLWKPYIQAIQAVAPTGWQLETFATQMPTPLGDGGVATDPLVIPGVGSISFNGRADTVPDVAAWLDALNAIPGFSGATLTSASVTDDNGVSYYETATTVQVDASAFAERFVEGGGQQ